MSVLLYPRRVFWNGRAGCVRNDPHVRELAAPPELPGCVLRIVEIDYAPGIVAQLREPAGPMRDMTATERAACDRLLADLAATRRSEAHHG